MLALPATCGLVGAYRVTRRDKAGWPNYVSNTTDLTNVCNLTATQKFSEVLKKVFCTLLVVTVLAVIE